MQKNLQFLYKQSGLLLKIQIVDNQGVKYFKDTCRISDRKRVLRIFQLLEAKFDVSIPENLKNEISGWDSLSY